MSLLSRMCRRYNRSRSMPLARAAVEALEQRRLLSLAPATDLAISDGALSWTDHSDSETE